MKWDLFDSANWQCLLDTKIMEDWLRKADTKKSMSDARVIHSGSQLDMPNSWCERLFLDNIGEFDWISCETMPLNNSIDLEFDERYPNGEKTIYYKRVIYERFSPFLNKNGLIKRLRRFADLDYTDELKCWEWYQQRKDRLSHIEYDLKANTIAEHFSNGRSDYLKCESLVSCHFDPRLF